MSRSPTSAELSSTSCYPNTHSVWFTKAVVPFESVLQHPENSQVAGFWILFNGLLQNHTSFRIDLPWSPFPSGFRHSKSSGKIPYGHWFIASPFNMGWKNVWPGLACRASSGSRTGRGKEKRWASKGIELNINIQYINCIMYPNYLGIKYRWNS